MNIPPIIPVSPVQRVQDRPTSLPVAAPVVTKLVKLRAGLVHSNRIEVSFWVYEESVASTSIKQIWEVDASNVCMIDHLLHIQSLIALCSTAASAPSGLVVFDLQQYVEYHHLENIFKVHNM